MAILARALGDLDLAEEAAQDAFAIAAERWPRDGAPPNPGAWLVTTARNRAIDRIRRERTLAAKLRLLDIPEPVEDEVRGRPSIEDERLELLFACCHPALALEAQVALTLRALGGLTTRSSPRALLVSPETMKRRLSRAKAKIRDAGIPFAVPPAHLLPDRLAAVLAVVYLVFNEGYSDPRGRPASPTRRSAWAVCSSRSCPTSPSRTGSWRSCCATTPGAPRASPTASWSCWRIRTARCGTTPGSPRAGRSLDRAIALRGRGAYVLQAAIASLQAEPEIDWREVAALYGELGRATGSPVVELNRAVAVAEAGAPAGGARRSSSGSISTATATCTPPAASCCGGSAGRRRRAHAYRRALELTRLRARAAVPGRTSSTRASRAATA